MCHVSTSFTVGSSPYAKGMYAVLTFNSLTEESFIRLPHIFKSLDDPLHRFAFHIGVIAFFHLLTINRISAGGRLLGIGHVCLVCLVGLVYLIEQDHLDERNKPDEPDRTSQRSHMKT